MTAARAAGMRAVFARYGYLDAGVTDDFGAEHVCASVPALHDWLEREGLVAPPRRTTE
jgi:phosphoglycolate phosphatase-like HAD superfamily hydrolase